MRDILAGQESLRDVAKPTRIGSPRGGKYPFLYSAVSLSLPEKWWQKMHVSDVADCTSTLRKYVCGDGNDEDQVEKALALFCLRAGNNIWLAQFIEDTTERVCAQAKADQNYESARAHVGSWEAGLCVIWNALETPSVQQR